MSPSFNPLRISVLMPSLAPVRTRRGSTWLRPSFVLSTVTVVPRTPILTPSEGTSSTFERVPVLIVTLAVMSGRSRCFGSSMAMVTS